MEGGSRGGKKTGRTRNILKDLVVHRKRPGKGPEPAEVIQALERCRLATQEQLRALTQEHEALRAHEDALGAVVRSLEELLAATRPLRVAAGGAAAAVAEDSAMTGWTDLREEWRLMQIKTAPSGSSPSCSGGAHGGDGGNASSAEAASNGSSGVRSCAEPRDGAIGCAAGGPGGRARSHASGHGGSGGAGEGASPAAAAAPRPAGGGALALPQWAEHVDLGGGPDAALRRYRELDAPAVAARVRDFVHCCGVDLYRLAAGAADPGAEARLGERLGQLMALSGALLAAKPQLLGEVTVYRLDTLTPLEPGGAGGAPPEHWSFVMLQAQLSHRQELAFHCLMKLHSSRMSALLLRRDALLARQAENPADGDAQSQVLAELEIFQIEYGFFALAYNNAMYGCILSPRQAAGVWVASFPYVPQLIVLYHAFQGLVQGRQQQQQQQQPERQQPEQRQQPQQQQQQQQPPPEQQQQQPQQPRRRQRQQ